MFFRLLLHCVQCIFLLNDNFIRWNIFQRQQYWRSGSRKFYYHPQIHGWSPFRGWHFLDRLVTKISIFKSSYIHYKISHFKHACFQNGKTIYTYIFKQIVFLWTVNKQVEERTKGKILSVSTAQIPFPISIIFQPQPLYNNTFSYKNTTEVEV